jgi:F0F1-type ATP synthase epsilon subunit
MNEIFADLIRAGVVKVYMDNILVYTDTIEEHREVNQKVLQILWENKLYIKPEKCEFEKGKIKFLGVVIGNGHVRMDPKEVAVIRDWTIPKTKKDVQAFWGFCNFYHCFIRILGKSPS